MPQTLLVLFAIFLGGQLMLSWQRDGVRSQENLIRIELESQARGVASEVFEILVNKPFDQNMNVTSPDGLTPEEGFGSERAFPGEIVDLDDVDDMQPYRVVRTLTDPDGDLQELEFWVTAEVDYVTDESGIALVETGGAKTFYKMVTATIRSPLLTRYFNTDEGVRVSRVYSFRQ
jgi:hypothetical protein